MHDVNTKVHNFSEKLKMMIGKCRVKKVTWSPLPFAVNKVLNLSNVDQWDHNARFPIYILQLKCFEARYYIPDMFINNLQ